MKKHLQLFILLIILGTSTIFAQGFQMAQKAGGTGVDRGNGINVDASGNTYVTGNFEGTALFDITPVISMGSSDVFIAKYNAAGAVQWVEQAGGGGYDVGHDITSDASGNVYVTGFFTDTATFDTITLTSAGAYSDVFIAKYNALGVVQWAKKAGGGTSGDSAYAYGVGVDASGNVYITGAFTDSATFDATTIYSSGVEDVFIAQYNSSGVLQWAEKAGGTGAEAAYSIGIDASGNTYLTGYFSGAADFGSTPVTITSYGGKDIFIACYNNFGALQWVEKAGSTSDDAGWSIITDDAGNSSVTGYFRGNATFATTNVPSPGGNGNDIFVARYNSAGVFQWVAPAGGTGDEEGYGISTDAYGNAYIAGRFNGTATFETTPITSSGLADIFIAKYDTMGVFQWVQEAGGTSTDESFAITADSSGNAYLTGRFHQSATFGSYVLDSIGNDDIFIAKIAALTTDSISDSTLCQGAILDVFYTVNGGFGSGNIFTAELSDSFGSFASPVNIGTLASTVSDTITATIPLSALAATGYRIRVVASIPATASSDNGFDITINALPNVTLSSTLNDTCSNVPSFPLTGGSPSGGTYSGPGVNAMNFEPATAGAGTHTITYTYTDLNSCVNSDSTTFIIDPSPVVNLGPDISTCLSSEILDAENPGDDYLWSTSATSQTITVSVSDTFDVVVTNSFLCSSTDTIIVQVNTPPTVNLGNNITICDANSDVVTLDAGPGFASYAWTGSFTTQTITIHGSTLGAGTYNYSVTVTDVNGCTATDAIVITVTSCTGIEESNSIPDIAIYPNPNEGSFSIEINTEVGETITLKVVNTIGEVIIDEEHTLARNQSKLNVNMPDAPPGVYFLQLKTTKGLITRRVIVN